MPTLEMEVGDAVLDRQAEQAYLIRSQGAIQLWKAKEAGLKSIKLEGLEGGEVARIKSDLVICTQEIAKIEREVKLAHEMGSPGLARQAIKRPAPLKRTIKV